MINHRLCEGEGSIQSCTRPAVRAAIPSIAGVRAAAGRPEADSSRRPRGEALEPGWRGPSSPLQSAQTSCPAHPCVSYLLVSFDPWNPIPTLAWLNTVTSTPETSLPGWRPLLLGRFPPDGVPVLPAVRSARPPAVLHRVSPRDGLGSPAVNVRFQPEAASQPPCCWTPKRAFCPRAPPASCCLGSGLPDRSFRGPDGKATRTQRAKFEAPVPEMKRVWQVLALQTLKEDYFVL